MIPTGFEYERATSLDDAVAKLAAANGSAKLLAGGHSLVPLMKLRLSEPQRLIDIARVPGLSGVREKDGRIEIGAGTVHHDVASSALLQERCPMVSDAAGEIGDPQVRNRGTLGGSLAHADPSADYPAVMLALDAEIHIKGPGGWRTVKASDFFQDLFTVDLAPDEIIAGVQFAPVKAAAYAKLHQRASHYAIVGVAAALDVSGGNITSARVGLTGATTHAVRLTGVEQALAGRPATPATIGAAATLAGEALQAVNSDLHASEEYRRAMVPVFAKRALAAALARVS
jgi:carbon-monoxide dehydrogenase medium subunit